MHPHRTVRRTQLAGTFGEAVIHFKIGFPVGILEADLPRKRMEERPQAPIAKPVVVTLEGGLWNVHPRQFGLRRPIPLNGSELRSCRCTAAPPEPLPASRTQYGLERGDQSAYRPAPLMGGGYGRSEVGQSV